MRSEHLLHKVTPTGPACADPAAHKVRLLTGNGDFQLALKSAVIQCWKDPHYHLKNGTTRLQVFLPPADNRR